MFPAPNPFASLSSGLLARKGQARPAMRPQGFAMLGPATSLDDLGWNDMGLAASEPELPPVLIERAALKEEVEQLAPVPVEPRPAARAVALSALPGPRAAAKGKAAFTLRLDARRHLRLRLASAVTHRSSQALLIQALDALLETLPEVEELARQCPGSMGDPA